jgi:serine/threonine-protein kinase
VAKRDDTELRRRRRVDPGATADLDAMLETSMTPMDIDELTAHGATSLPDDFEDTENTDVLLGGLMAEAPVVRAPAEGSVVPQVLDDERYEDRGVIGRGGVGEVRRVFDRKLQRVVAMKTLHPHKADRLSAYRFQREAVVSAQLQHPAIVPIYDLGRRPDGSTYYTMREVSGDTLKVLIGKVHSVSVGMWRTTEEGWSLTRLVSVLVRVAEAVAFAHARGAVHRDLKPDNIMVGDYGDVQLLDWGLVKVVGEGVAEPVVPHADRTRAGSITGTPAYMSPEQALGEVHKIGPGTDVYSLGAILFTILTNRLPLEGNLPQIVSALIEGRIDPPSKRTRLPVPSELEALCKAALVLEIGDRPTATELADALRSWTEGAPKRAEAMRLVQSAQLLLPRARVLRQRGQALRTKSEQMLSRVPTWASEERKLGAWALADQADDQAREGRELELEARRSLQKALVHDPDCREAHKLLADAYRRDHQRAEARGDTEAMERAEDQLRTHLDALPHAQAAVHVAYLAGEAPLQLATEPSGAEVRLYRFETRHRRLVAAGERELGVTPLDTRLPMGSYQLVIRKRGHHVVRYPIELGRLNGWSRVPPGGDRPLPIRLPRRGTLRPNDVFVPAGWFRAGDHRCDAATAPARVWLDDYVIGRFPVTVQEYVDFLDDLMAQGRAEEALQRQPRRGLGGAPLLDRTPDGSFAVPEGDSHILTHPSCPVVGIDYRSACAYAVWRGQRDGLPWRLPSELEWEKAARGVDGRLYPWGDHFDPTWARIRSSTRTRPMPTTIDTYPVDTSVYGVRGMGGNTADWCADVWSSLGPDVVNGRAQTPPMRPEDPSPRNARGGAWHATFTAAQSPGRLRAEQDLVSAQVGLRLARSL